LNRGRAVGYLRWPGFFRAFAACVAGYRIASRGQVSSPSWSYQRHRSASRVFANDGAFLHRLESKARPSSVLPTSIRITTIGKSFTVCLRYH
jgi:hypothetical protein